MSEHAAADDTMKIGLLMESAQALQKLAEFQLEQLRAHAQGLDDVVRAEINRTLIEELKSLTTESDRAARALRDLKRTVQLRGALWNVGVVVLCTVIPGAIAYWTLPSVSTITALTAQRDALAQSIAQLERRGGKVDWRSCGAAARLCVRVDRKAPGYGEKADYFVLKGY